MASFDFIRSAAQAYEFVWQEKAYLLRMALPVWFVHVACLFAVYLFSSDDILRMGLLLLPSYILEAIFAVFLVRFVAYGEPILSIGHAVSVPDGFKPVRQFSCGGYSRLQAVQSGIIVYILISLFFHVVAYAGGEGASSPTPEQLQDPAYAFGSLLSVPIACFILVAIARFFFAYVPFALGYSFRTFFKVTGGWGNSVRLVIGFLLCVFPPLIFMGTCIAILRNVFAEDSAGYIIVDAIGAGFMLIVLLSLVVSYMTYGLEKMLSDSVTKRS